MSVGASKIADNKGETMSNSDLLGQADRYVERFGLTKTSDLIDRLATALRHYESTPNDSQEVSGATWDDVREGDKVTSVYHEDPDGEPTSTLLKLERPSGEAA